MKNILLTFGCSWTFGIGVGWKPGMPRSEYQKIHDDKAYAAQYSFRAILANQYNLTNKNFAVGGSSNDLQFRQAENHLLKTPHNEFDNVIVIWGITSVYRKEWYNVEQGVWENVMFADKLKDNPPIAREYIKNHLHPSVENSMLESKMLLWNTWFEHHGIKNYWFNTFNTHKYNNSIPRMLYNGVDLLTLMSQESDDGYHKSRWYDEVDIRSQACIDRGLLNPISRHPTVEGHKEIANLLHGAIQRHQ